jgi:hypothetical protein
VRARSQWEKTLSNGSTLKANKAGDAFAAEKISNFGPRKAGLKTIFGLQEKNLYAKVDPSPQLFSWSQRGLRGF